jgi:hypothetical protein
MARVIPSTTVTKARRRKQQKVIYQQILPATSHQTVAAVGELVQLQPPLTTKEKLRAAILSGRHKSHAVKTKRLGRKKLCQKSNPYTSQREEVCLTDEDRFLLEKWKRMQQCPASNTQTAASISPHQSKVLEIVVDTRSSNSHSLHVADYTKQVTVAHENREHECIGSELVRTSASYELGTSCLLQSVAATGSDTITTNGSMIQGADSSDIRLIDICLSEMTGNSPPAADILTNCSSLEEQFNNTLSLVPTAVASGSELFSRSTTDNGNNEQLIVTPIGSAAGYGLGLQLDSACMETSSLSADLRMYESLDEMLFGLSTTN